MTTPAITPESLPLNPAITYANWLVATVGEAAHREQQDLYRARLAEAQPLPVTVTRHQCPHCHRTWAKQSAATAHIARCWKNPAVRSCKTCTHLDQEDAGDFCFPGRPCNCNDGWEVCAAGISITDGLITDCPLWSALTDH